MEASGSACVLEYMPDHNNMRTETSCYHFPVAIIPKKRPICIASCLKIILLGGVILCCGYWIYLGSTAHNGRMWWRTELDKNLENSPHNFMAPSHLRVWNFTLSYLERTNQTKIAKIIQYESRQSKLCVYTHNMGRLGNRIFQVAGLLGIARDKGMRPFFELDNELLTLFQLPDVELLPPGQCNRFPSRFEHRIRACDPETYNFSNKRSLQLKGYFQSWKYFRNITSFIRRQYQLRPTIKHEASIALMRTLLLQTFSLDRFWSSTLVAVHVRRTDMVGSDANTAPPSYLQHATQYFRKLFRNVLFVAASDDITWTMKYLPHNDTVFLQGNRAELDFAILSMCDHTIMTIGTFGWWIAWLVDGITTYYKYPHVKDSFLDNNTALDNYIPPGWIGLE
ncbi:galactoside alpha-(1,2)-fucosyltransferase 2-like [Liolophura sinensis]|uniref:galactoside alpha-(1,2)-fucosyltransferase 2-like n=1 Tax=Liolophura sinensis TaxID=3198878 RepID=UPI003158FBAE